MVAAMAHQKGKARSATKPKAANTVQNIFRCMPPFYGENEAFGQLLRQKCTTLPCVRQREEGNRYFCWIVSRYFTRFCRRTLPKSWSSSTW